jgi:hypothetical protein
MGYLPSKYSSSYVSKGLLLPCHIYNCRGEFNVLKRDKETQEDNIVFTYTTDGATFGELSLMYGKARAASVIAKTSGKLWVIGRAAFRAVVMKGSTEGMLKIFSSVSALGGLSKPQLQRLCGMTVTETFKKGDPIIPNEEVIVRDEIISVFCLLVPIAISYYCLLLHSAMPCRST